MASDEEGNKGIKRKSDCEESAEESANKHVCPDDGTSTPLETKQVEQAEGNVKKTNWMKCCDVEDSEARPQCDMCYQHHLFYIDPSTFKDHCKKKHPDIDTEVHESEWMIFRYFDTVKNAQHLKCKRCDESLEVLEFKGPFVEHFDDAHNKIVEQRFQGEDENAEEVEHLTKKFIAYLYEVYKEDEEEIHDLRLKWTWWMYHVKRVEKDTLICGVSGCQEPFSASLKEINIKDHVHYHYQKLKLRKNEENWKNWKNFLFDDYKLKCKRCHKVLRFIIFTFFTHHLEQKHNIVAPWKDNVKRSMDESGIKKADKYINELMLYLIKNNKIH